jgi:ketosteroid isomerase-like protein
MSQENVEIVRRLYAELEQGNFWLPEFFDSSIRIRWLDAVGAESETVGLQDMGSFMINWLGSFERVSLTAKRIIEAGDKVVVIATWWGRGKSSSADTKWDHAAVWTLRDGKAISVISYVDPDEALKAVGLQE